MSQSLLYLGRVTMAGGFVRTGDTGPLRMMTCRGWLVTGLGATHFGIDEDLILFYQTVFDNICMTPFHRAAAISAREPASASSSRCRVLTSILKRLRFGRWVWVWLYVRSMCCSPKMDTPGPKCKAEWSVLFFLTRFSLSQRHNFYEKDV